MQGRFNGLVLFLSLTVVTAAPAFHCEEAVRRDKASVQKSDDQVFSEVVRDHVKSHSPLFGWLHSRTLELILEAEGRDLAWLARSVEQMPLAERREWATKVWEEMTAAAEGRPSKIFYAREYTSLRHLARLRQSLSSAEKARRDQALIEILTHTLADFVPAAELQSRVKKHIPSGSLESANGKVIALGIFWMFLALPTFDWAATVFDPFHVSLTFGTLLPISFVVTALGGPLKSFWTSWRMKRRAQTRMALVERRALKWAESVPETAPAPEQRVDLLHDKLRSIDMEEARALPVPEVPKNVRQVRTFAKDLEALGALAVDLAVSVETLELSMSDVMVEIRAISKWLRQNSQRRENSEALIQHMVRAYELLFQRKEQMLQRQEMLEQIAILLDLVSGKIDQAAEKLTKFAEGASSPSSTALSTAIAERGEALQTTLTAFSKGREYLRHVQEEWSVRLHTLSQTMQLLVQDQSLLLARGESHELKSSQALSNWLQDPRVLPRARGTESVAAGEGARSESPQPERRPGGEKSEDTVKKWAVEELDR